MIRLFVLTPAPSLVADKSPKNVGATLQFVNEKGLIKLQGPVECDLVADENDHWALVGMRPKLHDGARPFIEEKYCTLLVDEIIPKKYGIGTNVGEDFDQPYTA